jgi:LysM repeat protein
MFNSKLNKKLFFVALALLLLAPGCARLPQRVSKPPGAPSAPIVGTPGFYHTVQRGQTLFRIAKNYQVDWHELMAINHVSSPSRLETGQKIFIPQKASTIYKPAIFWPVSLQELRTLVGPKNNTSDWRTITLHHSATLQGDAQIFNRDHKRRHMGGLFYHFVIGNGTGTPEGALEVGWRWQRQVKANRPYDIQICVVGDFSRQQMSEEQFGTLIHLIQLLEKDYNIPTGLIRRHEDIQGKHTECPGRNFPFGRVLRELMNQGSFAPSR